MHKWLQDALGRRRESWLRACIILTYERNEWGEWGSLEGGQTHRPLAQFPFGRHLFIIERFGNPTLAG